MTEVNALIYSVSYDNYQNKILHDKENKTQGTWKIGKDAIPHLKFAYVYLKNSEQMIVKKYTIKSFERNNPAKGYHDDDQQCFIFESSEDVFFEYPHAQVQGRQYRTDSEMDALPRLSQEEIDRRLEKSKTTPTVEYTSAELRSDPTNQDARTRLRQVLSADFHSNKPPPVDIAMKMIETVESDPEQDLNALLNEYYISLETKTDQ